MKQKVIAIVGPTAVGKTKLSIEIAKQFNGEIISGDAMQVYKGLDIGTAKISKRDREGIMHYMIDLKQPDETFSVAEFQRYVRKYIEIIGSRNKLPILVGGSGLYIQAALYDYQFSRQKRDEAVTEKLQAELDQTGIEPLYNRLQRIDPIQAEKIHPNNHRRVIRALEIYETTGLTMSEYHKRQAKESPYEPMFIGLEMERHQLYERINMRVDEMIANGLVQEVKSLYDQGLENCQSMQAIGYKELVAYFNDQYHLHDAIELIKRNSRRYAKRQYTWFKNKMDIRWYHIQPGLINERFGKIIGDLAGILKDK